jgi:hypothetical protein
MTLGEGRWGRRWCDAGQPLGGGFDIILPKDPTGTEVRAHGGCQRISSAEPGPAGTLSLLRQLLAALL